MVENSKNAPSITAFFPAFNDGGTIGSLVVTTIKTLEEITTDFEVIVIENGSTDYTVDVLKELAEQYPEQFRFLAHREPLGYGGALRTGFRESTKDLIFYTDGDAQYDPREIKLLLPAMNEHIEVVNGYKIDRNDPFHRIIIGRIYHNFVKIMFGFRLRDVDCDFRLIRRSVFETIELESDSGTICLELVKKLQDAGYHFAEVPVHHFHRTYGQSQFFNFPRLWRTGVQLLGLWWKLVIRREHMRRNRRQSSVARSRD